LGQAPKEESLKISKSSSAGKAKTMDELMAKQTMELVVPKKGDHVKGIIVAKNNRSLAIEIGSKTEALVADKEFEVAREYVDELKVGEEIEAIVVSSDNDRGQVLLSLKQAAFDAKWELFEAAQKENAPVDVKGIDVNKGGLIVLSHGLRGFIPSSQFGKKYLGKFQTLRGSDLKAKVIEVDREKNRLIFSERHVSEAQEIAQREKALTQVEAQAVYEGVVSGVMPFGLFVTVEVPLEKKGETAQVEGLVHISEISWEKVEDPREYHKANDKIKVKVLGTDEQTGKLNLSVKQLSEDPWEKIEEKYPVGTTFAGTVTRMESFGVFINVEPGVDGLMHQTKMEKGKSYQKGDKLTVTVESVSGADRRMSLSPVLTQVPITYK